MTNLMMYLSTKLFHISRITRISLVPSILILIIHLRGRMSSKKLFDQSVKLEKLWSHIFTATISLTQPEAWFRKVREIVEKQQSGPIWMSETKVTLPTCALHQHHFLHACHYLIYFDFCIVFDCSFYCFLYQ